MPNHFSLDDLSSAQRRALMDAAGGIVNAQHIVLAALRRRGLIHLSRDGSRGSVTPLGRTVRRTLLQERENRPLVGPLKPEVMDAVVDMYLSGKSLSVIAKRERLLQDDVIAALQFKQVYVEPVSA
jgi:hypothetical protein